MKKLSKLVVAIIILVNVLAVSTNVHAESIQSKLLDTQSELLALGVNAVVLEDFTYMSPTVYIEVYDDGIHNIIYEGRFSDTILYIKAVQYEVRYYIERPKSDIKISKKTHTLMPGYLDAEHLYWTDKVTGEQAIGPIKGISSEEIVVRTVEEVYPEVPDSYDPTTGTGWADGQMYEIGIYTQAYDNPDQMYFTNMVTGVQYGSPVDPQE